MMRLKRNTLKQNYHEPSLSPTPEPQESTLHTFMLAEEEKTWLGMNQNRLDNVTDDGGLSFKLLSIHGFKQVEEESQILGTTLTSCGIVPSDIVLVSQCPGWWWISVAVCYIKELKGIGWKPAHQLHRLRYPSSSPRYHVEQQLFHQVLFDDQVRTPQTIRCKIEKIEPEIYAGSFQPEYKIVVTRKRKRNGVRIKGGWTAECMLDPNSKPWNITEESIELYIARKAAANNNLYYIENYASHLQFVALDLQFMSSFWKKPLIADDWEDLIRLKRNKTYIKTSELIAKTKMKNLIQYTLRNHKIKQFTLEINIKRSMNSQKHRTYGLYLPEFEMEYQMIPYLKNISDLKFTNEYIIFELDRHVVQQEFDLDVVKTLADGSQIKLHSNLIIKYHRESSVLFVNKCTIKLHNRHMAKIK